MSLARILEWKLGQVYFDAKCGTRENPDGSLRIVKWDSVAAGRPMPTKTEIQTWTNEWVAADRPRPPSTNPLTAEELYEILESKGTVTPEDRPRPKPVRVR